MKKNYILFFFIVFAISSISFIAFKCKKTNQSPIIARVNYKVLTLEDLKKSIPSNYDGEISKTQVVYYVKQWIENEMLYQEALHQNIDKEEEVKKRIEKMKKDLLSSEIIKRNTVSSRDYSISKETIKQYYENHKDSFIRTVPVFKIMEIVVDDIKTAWNIRKMINNNNFLYLASKYSEIPVPDPRTSPFVSSNKLPPKFADVVKQIRINGTTAPIEFEGKYYIIRVLDKHEAGTTSSLDEVRDQIVSTLSAKAQKKDVEELIGELKLKIDYEFHIDRIRYMNEPNDTLVNTD